MRTMLQALILCALPHLGVIDGRLSRWLCLLTLNNYCEFIGKVFNFVTDKLFKTKNPPQWSCDSFTTTATFYYVMYKCKSIISIWKYFIWFFINGLFIFCMFYVCLLSTMLEYAFWELINILIYLNDLFVLHIKNKRL